MSGRASLLLASLALAVILAVAFVVYVAPRTSGAPTNLPMPSLVEP